MKAFKFCKIDLLRSRSVMALCGLIVVLFAIYFMMDSEGLGFIAGYLGITTVIIASVPFNLEQKYESGFIDMLPGTIKQRVHGRYLYAAIVMALCSLLGLFYIVLFIMLGNKAESYIGAVYLAIVSVTVFNIAMEYLIFYATGKGKSQKILPVCQLALPMVLFLALAKIGEYMDSNTNLSITWIVDNKYPIAIATVFVCIALFLISMQISIQICKRRDYA